MTAGAPGGDNARLGLDDTTQLPPLPAEGSGSETTAVLPSLADRLEGPARSGPGDAAPVPAMPTAPPPMPSAPPAAPGAPLPTTGWTTMMPAVPAAAPQPAAPQPSAPAPAVPPLGVRGGMGGGMRGRILVVEGGYGGSGRRPWARGGGAAQAPVLSAMLAAVSPQILLAAEAVDAVHLPGAVDPQSVLAHLRAAARHPGPLLIVLGGHLVTDRRAEHLFLTLRDSKAADSLPWQALAAELSHRPAEWDTLVIADLSADQAAWPLVSSAITPLVDGTPLWAAVHPDPDRIGIFTSALVEALHGGRQGAEAVLSPEQLRQQVHSVLRTDAVTITAHAPNRPIFRNTSRQIASGPAEPRPYGGPRPAAVSPRPKRTTPKAGPRPEQPPVPHTPTTVTAEPTVVAVASGAVLVSLVKAGVPPTPRPPVRPWSLVKVRPGAAVCVDLRKAGVPPTVRRVGPAVVLTKATAGAPAGTSQGTAAAPGAALPADATVSMGASATSTSDRTAGGAGATGLADAVAPAGASPGAVGGSGAALPADATVSMGTPAAGTSQSAAGGAGQDVGGVTTSPTSVAPAQAADAGAPEGVPAAGEPFGDLREAIGSIVRSADAGDHALADELARALEASVTAAHGPVAPAVLQVRQVRAHVARLAGRSAEAAEIYRQVALTLLRTEGPEHQETQRAATNAEACWRSIADRAEALKVAPEIIELRAHLPGPDGRKLRAAERYLKQLAAAKSDG